MQAYYNTQKHNNLEQNDGIAAFFCIEFPKSQAKIERNEIKRPSVGALIKKRMKDYTTSKARIQTDLNNQLLDIITQLEELRTTMPRVGNYLKAQLALTNAEIELTIATSAISGSGEENDALA